MFEWIKEVLVMFADYLKCWVLVNHYEGAVILRKGVYYKTLTPGLYWKVPFIDYSLTCHVKTDTMEFEPIAITTLDNKTISIGMEIEYEVEDIKLYLVETNDAPSNMRDIARGEMSDYLEDINWVDIKKKTTKNALRKIISSRFETMGIKLRDLKFTNKSESRVYRLFSDKDKIV